MSLSPPNRVSSRSWISLHARWVGWMVNQLKQLDRLTDGNVWTIHVRMCTVCSATRDVQSETRDSVFELCCWSKLRTHLSIIKIIGNNCKGCIHMIAKFHVTSNTRLLIFSGRTFWPKGLCQLLTASLSALMQQRISVYSIMHTHLYVHQHTHYRSVVIHKCIHMELHTCNTVQCSVTFAGLQLCQYLLCECPQGGPVARPPPPAQGEPSSTRCPRWGASLDAVAGHELSCPKGR